MRTLSFAVAIATMITASHAEPLEDYLRTLKAALIEDRSSYYHWCARTAGGRNAVAMADAYFACIEAERTRLWAQHLRRLFGDPGRH
jgi:hypothetical protein